MPIPNSKLNQVAFSTQFRYEYIVQKGHATYTLGTNPIFNTVTVTIPHNLGYEPFFRVWIQLPGSSNLYYKATGTITFGLESDYQIDEIYADTTNLYVTIEKNSAGGLPGIVYYRIYGEQPG